MTLSKFINATIIITFIGFSLFSILKLSFTGEFFLNYTNGFIRRGLLGEIVYLASKNFNINPHKLSISINIISKFFLIAIILWIYIKKQVPTLLIFSYPVVFSGLINSNGRLDFILLLLFITSFIALKNKKHLIFILVSLVGVLIHEVYFFLLIIPMIALFLNSKNNIYLINLFLLFFVFISCSFTFKGTLNQANEIQRSWNLLNFNPEFSYVYRDIISNRNFYIFNIINTKFQVFGFFLNNLLCVLFILLCGLSNTNNNKYKLFASLILSQNIIFFSLCFVACDYSRWYFLLFTSIIIFYYFFVETLVLKINLSSFEHKSFTILRKIRKVKYFIYLFIGIPFAGWSFDSYYHSILIFKIKEIFDYI